MSGYIHPEIDHVISGKCSIGLVNSIDLVQTEIKITLVINVIPQKRPGIY